MNYRRSLILEADPAAVYAALTTPAGMSGWWTQDCEVPNDVGGTIHVRFGRTFKDMLIERLEPDREVRWRCTRAHIHAQGIAPDEWVGTRLVFRLMPDGEGRTQLDFDHIGLVPALECYALCSNGWNRFLDSLQAFVETGRGTPHEIAESVAA